MDKCGDDPSGGDSLRGGFSYVKQFYASDLEGAEEVKVGRERPKQVIV